jgi:hypothetical protein
MRRLNRLLYVAAVLLVPAVSDGGLAAATIGNTTIVVRTVTGVLSTEKRRLQFEDDIYNNEAIETFNESATEITFLDKTTLSLGPNTKVTLDRFIYDPDPANSAFVLTIAEGALRFASGVLPSESYKIHTPVATIGIRGTVVDVVVERETRADGTTQTNVNLTVVEGEADLFNCDGVLTLVPEGLSSSVAGSLEGCSQASVPGLQPEEVTAILRSRDEFLGR